MTENIRMFQVELTAMLDAAMDEIRQEVIELAIDADRILKESSPVDTGQFRANWLTSVGSPSDAQQEGSGGAMASASAAALASYPDDGFPVIYLQNNVPYADRLEDGHSTQKPLGVVKITVPALQAIWDAKTI